MRVVCLGIRKVHLGKRSAKSTTFSEICETSEHVQDVVFTNLDRYKQGKDLQDSS